MQRCIYVQDCTYQQFWRLVLVNVASMHILFFYTKIWYNSLSALKCIWQERYFQNLLCWVTARGGTVFWSGLNFFFFFFTDTGNRDRDKKQTCFPRTTFGAVQLYTSYCAVWNEVTPSGKMPFWWQWKLPKSYSWILWFTVWFFVSTSVTCLFLINSAGVIDWIDAERHKLSAFLDIVFFRHSFK